MPSAYVLINYGLSFFEDVEIINELKNLPEIMEVESLSGAYDLLVKVSADTMDKLKETITLRIGRNDKIVSMVTLNVMEVIFPCKGFFFLDR
jgi:DNA-binding Lrp family transcriptional regulator